MDFFKKLLEGKKEKLSNTQQAQQAQQNPQLLQQVPFQQQIPVQQYQNSQNLSQIPQQQQIQQQLMQKNSNYSSNSLFGQSMEKQKQPQVYNDDQPAVQSAKKQGKKEQVKIQLSLKAQRTMIKLKEKCILPAMIEVKATGGQRTSVDLVCVLDISGSMSGQKIQLLKETMKFLIETLTPSDRLCIITFNNFAKRICPLKPVTKQNIPLFLQWVQSIKAQGGTRIISGMQTAIKVMRQRVHKNQVSSVFLLSDGQDDKQTHKNLQKSLFSEQNKNLDSFSIHSFGFGKDHDEDLMTNIARVVDGNFFYIEELSTLDQAFCSALGSVISVAAKNFIIKLQNISKGLIKDVKIGKTFGQLWKKIDNNTFQIKIMQLMSGVQKNFIFELEIPYIDQQVGDLQRQHQALVSFYKAKDVQDQQISGQTKLSLTLLNQIEQIPEINENIDVLQHYLRLQAAAKIQQAIVQSQNNQNQLAQKNLDSVISSIQSNKRVRKQKMEPLLNDLKRARNNCQRQQFHTYGRKQMREYQVAHREQKANIKTMAYQNCVQTEMLENLRAKKRG